VRHRHSGRTPARHTDDWLMTYADMITLLLCFFVIMLFIAHARQQPIVAPVPLPATTQAPAIIEQPLQVPPILPPGNAMDDFQGNLPFHDYSEPEIEIESAPAPTPKEQVAATVVPATITPTQSAGNSDPALKGDRITTLEMNSTAFFDPGLAVISLTGRVILSELAARLQSDIYKDYLITVEGHTDDAPITTTAYPSNWELSTARAAAVVRAFIEQGIPPQRLRAAGYADTFPKLPNRDATGKPIPGHQAQNRRVVIKLEKIDKTE
jgi:flagellar motor protein MotB